MKEKYFFLNTCHILITFITKKIAQNINIDVEGSFMRKEQLLLTSEIF